MAEMSLQLPLTLGRLEHVKSMRDPMMALVLLVLGVNWQLSVLSKHWHSLSFGVGGSVVDASHVELFGGQLGNCVVPAELLDGTVGNVTLPYWACRRPKSALGVTLLPLMVTMPNWPSLDWAGK